MRDEELMLRRERRARAEDFSVDCFACCGERRRWSSDEDGELFSDYGPQCSARYYNNNNINLK